MYIYDIFPDVNLESKSIEFKGIIEEGKDKDGKNREIGWLKTIAGFANTEGGKLYVGVENKSHKIVALDSETTDRLTLMIHRCIRERITPKIDYDVAGIPVPGTSPLRYVIEVSVSASKSLPVIIQEGGLLGIYIRSFGQTVSASPEQVRDLILLSDNAPFDTAFLDVPYDSADYSKLISLAEGRGIQVTEKALISKHIISPDGMVSNGAALFADNCSDERTKISASVWPGLSKGGSIMAAGEEFTGNLLDGIQFAVSFIRNHSNNGFKKEANSRSEYISYPPRSVTEGVVNAVGHRNYFIYGSQIEINIFRDRLEITSPGSLLGVKELKKEKNIASIIPRRRNDIICSILELCKYMEEKGSGFDKIEYDYSGYGEEYRPFISSDASSFTLTLPDLTYSGVVSETESEPEVYTSGMLSGKNDLLILSYCYGQPRTIRDIAERLGVTASTYFRKSTITRLVSAGYLVQKTNGKVSLYHSNPECVFLK